MRKYPDAEMQFPTTNKVHRTQNSEKEFDVLQSLSILGYLALCNAMGILKTEDAPIVQEPGV